ncbi:MAG: LamG domain-containing protein [Limisphaerales bacterium]
MKTTTALLGIFTITLGLAAQVHAQTFLTNGLVAYYPFNGNANDASGNGNNGIFVPATSISNVPTLTSNHLGVANSAYSFNSGSYVYAIITNLPLANSARTISGWIKLNASSTSSEESVACWGYGDNNAEDCAGAAFGLWANFYAVDNGRNLYSWGSFNDVSAPYDLDFSTFYFVADTYDGNGNVTLFVNGMAIAQKNIGGYNTFTNNYLLRMGVSTHAPDWNNDYLDGSLDDIRIYNRALATNEIAQLYAIESAPNGTTLLQDNFDLTAVNTNPPDVNFQLAQRQTGTLAPVTYTKGLDLTFSQVGNTASLGELLLAGQAAGMGGPFHWITILSNRRASGRAASSSST